MTLSGDRDRGVIREKRFLEDPWTVYLERMRQYAKLVREPSIKCRDFQVLLCAKQVDCRVSPHSKKRVGYAHIK